MGNELVALGGAFVAAAVVARLGRRVGLPTIPLFVLAGIVFGPNTPGFVLVEHPSDLRLLASLGLVFLLFSVGLEVTPRTLVGTGGRTLAAGTVFVLLQVGGGILFGLALGWGTAEALVLGGALGISSSAIVTKVLVELHRLTDPETQVVLGAIVLEDLFVAVYLALLQPVLGGAHGTGDVVLSSARAFAFLAALTLLARFAPLLLGRAMRGVDDEVLTVVFVGLAVLAAGVAEEAGVSDAVGALGIGIVLARTPVADRVRRLVPPLRDAFAALFLFAFGLSVAPGDLRSVVAPIAVAVVLTAVLVSAGAAIAGRLHALDRRAVANVATTMLARGELSLVLASLAVAGGLDRRIGPLVTGYVLVLALASPLLAANTERFARRWSGRVDPASEAPT